nr:hypothetical protein CFP56_69372 [Quercus suber]
MLSDSLIRLLVQLVERTIWSCAGQPANSIKLLWFVSFRKFRGKQNKPAPAVEVVELWHEIVELIARLRGHRNFRIIRNTGIVARVTRIIAGEDMSMRQRSLAGAGTGLEYRKWTHPRESYLMGSST